MALEDTQKEDRTGGRQQQHRKPEKEKAGKKGGQQHAAHEHMALFENRRQAWFCRAAGMTDMGRLLA